MRSAFDDFALAGFVASAAAIIALAAADYWASGQQARAAEWVSHTHEVRANIARARSDLVELMALRDPDSYRASMSAVEADLARLRELVADSPSQLRRLDAIDAAVTPHILNLAPGDVRSAVTTLSSLDGEEQRLLEERKRDETRTLTWFRFTSGIAIGVMLLVLGALYALERRRYMQGRQAEAALRAEVDQRRLAEEALREFIVSLESVVNERTSLLSAAVDELARAKERLENLAEHDVLTGLPNRRLLLDRLQQALTGARRRGNHVAVLFVDLDKFKEVNDTHGHDAGDELLKEVARRLSSCVREADTVSREGGDEFVVILADLDEREDAGRVANKALVELAKPVEFGAKQFSVTPSIGVSYYPDDATEAQQLLKCADDAMYAAKDAGRNAVRFFEAGSQRVS
jgi:diguanylate cyclase (GGDEF)-like protein